MTGPAIEVPSRRSCDVVVVEMKGFLGGSPAVVNGMYGNVAWVNLQIPIPVLFFEAHVIIHSTWNHTENSVSE